MIPAVLSNIKLASASAIVIEILLAASRILQNNVSEVFEFGLQFKARVKSFNKHHVILLKMI